MRHSKSVAAERAPGVQRRGAGRGRGAPAARHHHTFALLALLWLFGVSGASAQGWYDAGWSHRKPITIDGSKVNGGPHANFPVLVSLASDAQLASRAQASGNDILFTAADGTTKLDHEIETFTKATGALIAWVRIPSLPAGSNTVIYMYYGNGAAANQQNATGVWTANYRLVWHLNESSGGSNAIKDSTSHANHGTDTGSPAFGAAGKIGGAVHYDGVNKYILSAASPLDPSASDLTASAWVRPAVDGVSLQILSQRDGGGTGRTWLQRTGSGNEIQSSLRQSFTAPAVVTGGTWYHIALTKSGTNTRRVYVNGVLYGENSDLATESANGEMVLGNHKALSLQVFNGELDELRIASVARSGDWLATEFANQDAPSAFHNVGTEQPLFNGAQFVSQSVPTTMTVGQSYPVSVTLKNTGTSTWTSAAEYRLGSQNAQNNTTWGMSRVDLPATIAPDGNVTFTFNVTAPATAGTYNFQWRMLREGVEWFGDLTTNVAVTVNPAVSSFNVVEPGAHAVNGKIFTKIAGQNFALDIVALDQSNAVATGFTGTVAVEVVDATSGGACAGLPLISTFTDQTFVGGDAGRKALSAPNTVADVYRNARIRVKFPTSSPTIVACSGDNFAIRPASLTFIASNSTPTIAGDSNVLNATTLTGTPLHRAGRPFRITATAYNGAATPVITTNYEGTPTAVLTQCAGSACTATQGPLTLGTWSVLSGGTVRTSTAEYRQAGAFNLQLQDATFAEVDAADGTPLSQRTIASGQLAVGRFVPDQFQKSAISVTPRSASPACAASSFTYMGELFEVQFRVTARATSPYEYITHYEGSLARLDLSDPAVFNFGAGHTSAGGVVTPLTSRLTVLQTSGTWVAGEAIVTALVAIQRAAAPDGPFNSLRLGARAVDLDGITHIPGNLNLDTTGDGSSDKRLIGTHAVRFGRLRLQNAAGSQLVPLPVPIEAQHWNGTAFIRNTDDHCTSIDAANVVLGNFQRMLTAAHTSATVGGVFSGGRGSLTLAAPGATIRGSVDVSINLSGGTAGASCVAGMPASTPLNTAYLQGAWCGGAFNRDPTARATFGVLRASDSIIYRRENF
jgi:hypothetical protein